MPSTNTTQKPRKRLGKKLSIMGLSKYISPPQFQNTAAPRPVIDFAPLLVPKDKKRKGASRTAPKPADRTILLAKSDNPTIPDVVLQPMTPRNMDMKVEDRLFDRCGSEFVLRQSKSWGQCRTSGSAVRHLKPHSHRKAVKVRREPSNAHTGASENTKRAAVDQDMDIELDATSQSDYCAYMAGLYIEDQG